MRLASSSQPHDAVTLSLSSDGSPICGQQYAYSVKRGSGQFKGASGSGSVRILCSGSDYSDQWSGTLYY